MSVDSSYLEYIEERLQPLGEIRIKQMFSGAGIYCNDAFFAIIDYETLYFKVDDSNRPDFEAANMAPLKPFEDKSTTMSYYEVPSDIMESSKNLIF